MTLMVIAFSAYGKKRGDSQQPYLETRINRDKAVEGEVLIYEVILHTKDPNIAGIQLSRNPFFDNLPVSRSAADSRLDVSHPDDERCYTAVIDRFFIDAAHVGKHKIKGGAYDVGYNRQVTEQDPFWGAYMADRVEVISLEAPDISVNISELPSKGKPDEYSGAVGDFSVEVEVPSGELRQGDGAFVIITIYGSGDLSEVALPDVRSIFPPELQFHSMTESRNHYIKEGSIGSEIEIECTFTPLEEGEFEIGKCGFSYFNPVSRRYEHAYSRPVTVRVSSSKAAEDTPPQYMDI